MLSISSSLEAEAEYNAHLEAIKDIQQEKRLQQRQHWDRRISSRVSVISY